MGTCFECRVTIDGEPHRRACLEPVREGMDGRARRPRRSSAGEGPRGARRPTPEALSRRPRSSSSAAGPAGIAAAVHAAEAGARTLLLDEQPRPGGQIWRRGERARRPPASGSLRLARSGATVLAGATVVDAPEPNELLVERDGLPRPRALRAPRARDGRARAVPPLPGLDAAGRRRRGRGAGAAEGRGALRGPPRRRGRLGAAPPRGGRRAASRPGRAIVGDRRAGAPRPARRVRRGPLAPAPQDRRGPRLRGARSAAPPTATGTWVREALGDAGAPARGPGRRAGGRAVGVRRPGLRLRPRSEPGAAAPPRLRDDGRAASSWTRRSARAGTASSRRASCAGSRASSTRSPPARSPASPPPGAGRRATLAARRARETAFAGRLARAFALRDELLSSRRAPTRSSAAARTSPLGRLAAAGSAREAKLHTRAGMGACQGRVCGPALGFLRGFTPDSVRPPLAPVPVGGAGGRGRRSAILAAKRFRSSQASTSARVVLPRVAAQPVRRATAS